MADTLTLGGRTFRSRLLVGTGKYPDYPTMVRALEASGADIVTVAVRRVNLDRSRESLLDHVDPKRYTLLPNTPDATLRRTRCAPASSPGRPGWRTW